MKRFALIIEALDEDELLSGFDPDSCMWRKYLMSGIGGCWYENEIITLRNPTATETKHYVSQATSIDFFLVIFLGHGFEKKDFLGFPETYVSFHDNENMSESDLNPGNPKCMLFFDCFRTMKDKSMIEKLVNREPKISSRSIDIRNKYDQYVHKCEKGQAKIYSASFNQNVKYRKSFGHVLINIAVEWGASCSNGEVLTINEAMSSTSDYFRKANSLQVPLYEGGRRRFHFPFAIH